MSRKHYEALAEIVHRSAKAAESADRFAGDMGEHCAMVRQLAYELSRYLSSTNARFSESKFLAACGLTFATKTHLTIAS